MSELQDVVTRNVRVLMAVRGIRHAKDLAAMLEVGPTTISQKMASKRQWDLDDIAKLAEAFAITPASLLSDVQAIVDPAAAVSLTASQSGSRGYPSHRSPARRHRNLQLTGRYRQVSQLADVIPLPRLTTSLLSPNETSANGVNHGRTNRTA